jgi:uncharacterized protein YbaR (Trm112 family)
VSEPGSTVDPALRALLVCPRCRGELEDHADGLGCRACALVYPVVETRPWMLPERAKKWRGMGEAT